MQKKVAIITRTKNRPILLPRVRQSVQDQSFKDFVWVLVNDAGEREAVDREADVARQAGLDVLVVHRERSVGMEAASNDGVRRTQTEYVVIHDDDDTWEPAFLERTVAFLDTDSRFVGVITHSTRVVERLTGEGPVFLSKEPYNNWLLAVYLIDLAQANRFPPISFLFRRDLYERLGGFDESLPVLGDWDFNLRAVADGDVGVIPEALANYHFRYDVHAAQYANSVTGGVSLHAAYDAIYRNRKLREDINASRVGLGHIVNAGRLYGHIEHQIRKNDAYFAGFDKVLSKLRLNRLVSWLIKD